MENLGFSDFLDLGNIENVMLTDGALKNQREVHLQSEQVRDSGRGRRYIAHSNPTLDSLEPLLTNATELSVLLLRGCEFLPRTAFPLEIFTNLNVLEISGSSYLTTIPTNTISQLAHLEYLNLSDLLIQNLPFDFFFRFYRLSWLIITRCSKLGSLPSIDCSSLEVLDLSHSTALHRIVSIDNCYEGRLRMIDLSYTALTYMPPVKSNGVTHLFLRGSKLKDINSFPLDCWSLRVLDLSGARAVKHISVFDLSRTQAEYQESFSLVNATFHLRTMVLRDCTSLQKLPSMRVLPDLEIRDISGCEKLLELPADMSSLRNLMELNLSGCSGLGILREGIFDQMSHLWKLDLSRTKVKHLPYFTNPASLSTLSLRDLELDSLETLKPLSNIKELDLKGLKITSSHELQLDFLQSLEKLQILNVSQTSLAKLPNMSSLQTSESSYWQIVRAYILCLIFRLKISPKFGGIGSFSSRWFCCQLPSRN